VSPKLGEMHKLKEEFREVFEKNTEGNEGLFALSDWIKKAMAYFPKSCQTMRRWIDEITAYFDNRTYMVSSEEPKLPHLLRGGLDGIIYFLIPILLL